MVCGRMLGICGVEGQLLKAVQSFYVDSRTLCPGRTEVWVGDCFTVND